MSSINRKYFDLPTQYAVLFGKIDLNNQKENIMGKRTTSFDSACKAQEALGGVRELPIKGTFERLAKSANDRMFDSERGQELLFKAEQYNMPIDRNNIDWLQLIDDIDQYESLLEEARELGIEWDESEYDPIPLEQEIEEVRHINFADSRAILSSFYSSRGVEV